MSLSGDIEPLLTFQSNLLASLHLSSCTVASPETILATIGSVEDLTRLGPVKSRLSDLELKCLKTTWDSDVSARAFRPLLELIYPSKDYSRASESI